MLKHVLMFKVKGSKTDGSADENIRALEQALLELRPKIHEIQAWEVGVNQSPSPHAFDLLLYSEFNDEAALEKYRVHPEHRKVVALIEKICQERHVVDYTT